MKKCFLLVLAFAFSICGYAVQYDNGTGATKSGSTWYSTIVSKQYDVQDDNNLDIALSYPSNQVKFDCWRGTVATNKNKQILVDQYLNGSWSNFCTYSLNDDKTWYRNVTSDALNPNATTIAFRPYGGTSKRLIENIHVRITTVH